MEQERHAHFRPDECDLHHSRHDAPGHRVFVHRRGQQLVRPDHQQRGEPYCQRQPRRHLHRSIHGFCGPDSTGRRNHPERRYRGSLRDPATGHRRCAPRVRAAWTHRETERHALQQQLYRRDSSRSAILERTEHVAWHADGQRDIGPVNHWNVHHFARHRHVRTDRADRRLCAHCFRGNHRRHLHISIRGRHGQRRHRYFQLHHDLCGRWHRHRRK